MHCVCTKINFSGGWLRLQVFFLVNATLGVPCTFYIENYQNMNMIVQWDHIMGYLHVVLKPVFMTVTVFTASAFRHLVKLLPVQG